MLAQRVTTDYSIDTAWQNFSVSYSYPVSFTRDLFSPQNPVLLHTLRLMESDKQHKIIVFIDEGVLSAQPGMLDNIQAYVSTHTKYIDLVCSPVSMVSGEEIKSDELYMRSMQQIVAEQRMDRHSFVIGIGGGALLDAVGLVAATAHRGIRHIRIPTTVLAQNDSGVGVKNSINQFGQKNYLGTFAPPFAVLNDYHFINTLQTRDKIAGMAEAVKVALIRDTEFYHWLEEQATELARFDEYEMQYMIKRCAELHMHQIANGGDPFEAGSARPLDFGHWAAHRLESMTHYELRHGEAVAIGIALDTRYSVLSGLLEDGADERVCRLLEKLGLDLWHPALMEKTTQDKLALVQGLNDFREHLGGELTITLLEDIGIGVEVHEMDESLVHASIEWLRSRTASTSAATHSNSTVLEAVSDIKSQDSSGNLAANSGKGSTNNSELRLVKSDNALNTSMDTLHVSECLFVWLENKITGEQLTWLKQRLSLLKEPDCDRDLYITLGLIPRKLGHEDLDVEQREIASAQQACAVNWDPSEWTVDNAGRCLVLVTLLQTQPTRFYHLFNELCASAELNEAIAFYRCTAILPAHEKLDLTIGAGLRTHIRAIFESIAHRNPYPALNFDQHRWNHMVLKALFIDSPLWPIQRLDERANAELASILCDYAHERWAAGRTVTPELWRCVGPCATAAMMEDLHRVSQSENTLEQQAGVLAILSAPGFDQQQLRQTHATQVAMIEQGLVSWDSIGQELNRQTNH